MKSITLTILSLIILNNAPSLKITSSFTTNEGLPNNEVRALYNDPNGPIWIGSGGGAAWLENAKWQVDTRTINPVVNGVSAIMKDSQGNFWFGGLNEGHVYQGDSYQTFGITDDMGLDGRVIFSFHEDHNDNIWVGTTGGISIFDGAQWEPLTMEHGLSHNVVHDIDQDKNGAFWIATRKGGVNIYDGTNWEYLFPEKNCRKILKDDLNNMWVGTSDGVLMFDGVQWKTFEEGKTVLPMFKGLKGYIWCVANGTDILRISADGKSIYYANPTQNQAGEIYQLEYSDDGSVWAGTDQGIFVFH